LISPTNGMNYMNETGTREEKTIAKRIVLNISRMTTHNGPGIRTLIMFKGCPLRCIWCSTPESQKSEPELAVFPVKCNKCGECIPICPSNALALTNDTICVNRSLCNSCGKCTKACYSEALKLLGQPMSVDDLLEEVKKDLIIYKHSGGGVTLSGGEPLLHPDFTLRLVSALKEDGISVGVDTCGQVPWSSIESVLPYVDFFLWDIKLMDPEEHRKLTGSPNDLILDNLRAVSERNIPIYLRIPVIPGYNDSEENIRATSEFASNLSSVIEVHLLPLHHLGKARYDSLHRAYPLGDIPLITDSIMHDIKRIVESYRLNCSIVG